MVSKCELGSQNGRMYVGYLLIISEKAKKVFKSAKLV
jgi:hypothetical protein